MKKAELKQLIKPLVKECIHEVLLEEGLLSHVVAEVAKGLKQDTLVEAAPPPSSSEKDIREKTQASRTKMNNYRKGLMDAVGADAYNGVNLFENTEPLTHNEPSQGHSDLGSPRDAGVDITSLIGDSSAIWQALK